MSFLRIHANTIAATVRKPLWGPCLENVRCFLEGFSNKDVLRHFLGFPLPNAPAQLDEAILIGVDTEWWEKLPNPTTEVGIAELHPTPGFSAPGIHAENVVTSIRTQHVRVKEHAHLLNKFEGAGDPERFHFGTTVFMKSEDIPGFLYDTFSRVNYRGELRPIIFIGHATSSDFEKMESDLGLDVGQIGSIVRVIDTQEMAKEMDIWGTRGTHISLKELLLHFNIVPHDLHQAGNDIAYIMIVAVLMALKEELYRDESRRMNYLMWSMVVVGPLLPEFIDSFPTLPQAVVNGRQIQHTVDQVAKIGKNAATPLHFQTRYCTRCARDEHLRADCEEAILCTYCAGSSSEWIKYRAVTHISEKCVYQAET